jgi:hypothetical protein
MSPNEPKKYQCVEISAEIPKLHTIPHLFEYASISR